MTLRQKVEEGKLAAALDQLYGPEQAASQQERYQSLLEDFSRLFPGQEPWGFYSAPGRTEIGGNHTDHQLGKVLAAAVNLDMVCAASPLAEPVIHLYSQERPEILVELSALSPRPEEYGTSQGLIRGVAASLAERGYQIGGFRACLHSQVLPGSGLSSSAAFSVVIGTVLSHLYNGGSIDPITVALAGQEAENRFFGKPSGLMDQLACSVGGFALLDFAKPQEPNVKSIPFDLGKTGYALCIVNSGGSHADRTPDYAAIPGEMRQAAGCLGKEVLGQTDQSQLLAALPEIRRTAGDRAALRAIHFFEENARVPLMAQALQAEDFPRYLELVKESGRSSWMYLQNVHAGDPFYQELALALALTDVFLKGEGAFRVQGGGFAGTIQVYVPLPQLPAYEKYMEAVFGKGCCQKTAVRPLGGTAVLTGENI
ncbi:galactokinase family protein [Oscillospiraceae bacterium MB08-C2-2]|nr:galactokinase family protein [Oscillospiraceae bacterium MB08-C2-2]